ncbi:RNA polymerase sigma factor [Tengunoibacter tsumagoiensis]|uniref:RNA polymerase sigma factor n=1 Tax=Tengunoibacter tsumagoiensis TaxID=2014871 RepID=A0A401ZVM1_9CHLR|nr:RNA polymerase sigma factor [Tengunoibacter tsumagoiensis]GCE10968.1 RNA polymerase sigma factor [Tengunoibacter tsumagoiensis]
MQEHVSTDAVDLSETLLRSYTVSGTEREDPHDGVWQANIVARCLAGDEYAFALLTDCYGNLLLRTAFLIVHDEDTAKDIVQEALILAWKNMRTLREPHYLRAWLLKITVNQSVSFKRQFARRAALLREQLMQHTIDSVIRESDTQRGSIEDSLDLASAIRRLPINQRVVLTLYYYHKMTMPEISELLNVAENTLRKRLQSALEKIRRVFLEEQSFQDGPLSAEALHSRIRIHGEGL